MEASLKRKWRGRSPSVKLEFANLEAAMNAEFKKSSSPEEFAGKVSLTLKGKKNAQKQPPLTHVVSTRRLPPKYAKQWLAAQKKLDKAVASFRLGHRRPWPE